MAFTFVASAEHKDAAGVGSVATTAGMNVQIGHIIVAGIWVSSSTTVLSVADTAGNSFTKAFSGTFSGVGSDIEIWFSNATAANASDIITATFNASGVNGGIAATVYSGPAVTLDVTASGTASAATTATSGSFTPSGAGDLIYA